MQKNFHKLTTTFKSSIKSWDYFVNWSKVFQNGTNIEIQLNTLNYLLNKNNLKQEFSLLFAKDPTIIQTIPVLLAVRESNLEIYNKITNTSQIYDFKAPNKTADEYFDFINKTGLINLFKNNRIKNLVDYVIGVEVGLDSNGRKNRAGIIMEQIVELFVNKFCQQNQLLYIAQARPEKIKSKWGFDVKINKSARSFDFAIYNPKTNRLKLLETNFYNGGGSKLKSVCGEFRSLHHELKIQGIDLVWITDGLGWHTAIKPLQEAFDEMDFVFNLSMLEQGIFDQLEW